MQCPSVERTFYNLLFVYGRGRRSSSRTAHRLRLRSSPLCSLRRSSSPKKVTLRLCCSLVNALATRRLATNFFRYQEDRCCTFSLVGNAHRAFRGGVHRRMPFGRSTDKHKVTIAAKKIITLKCKKAAVLTGGFLYFTLLRKAF